MQESKSMREYRLFLQGHWRSGSTGETRLVINPATEQPVARIACATDSDLDQAIGGAAVAAASWAASAKERARILLQAAEILRTKIDTASIAYSEEQGQTYLRGAHGIPTSGRHTYLEWAKGGILVLPSLSWRRSIRTPRAGWCSGGLCSVELPRRADCAQAGSCAGGRMHCHS